MTTTSAVHTSAITSLPLLARGKVRDNYAVGDDRILMVASDRISAFDVIMGEPIPGKGALLTQMALFWFGKLGHICPNHLTGDAPESVVTPAELPQVTGRSMLVKRLKPIPVEAVVRGYLAGSGWKEYQENSAVCGVKLPPGLKNASKLPEPIYTPAAKAAVGEHDENITFERTVEMIGADLAEIELARDALRAMLKTNGPPPAGRFAELAVLEPVKDYPARHASTLLAFEAAVEAVSRATAAAQTRTSCAGTA